MHVDISRVSEEWPVDDARIQVICKIALAQMQLPASGAKDYEISVVLANDQFVQTLNAAYRGKDKPTNVLSFAQHDDMDGLSTAQGAHMLGDIVLAYETVRDEAAAQGKTLHDHLMHLIVHGLLHLLGYDHENDDDAKTMEQKEIQILALQGIKNPYADGFSVS